MVKLALHDMQAVKSGAVGWAGRRLGCMGSLLQVDLLGAQLGCDGAYHVLHWLWHRQAFTVMDASNIDLFEPFSWHFVQLVCTHGMRPVASEICWLCRHCLLSVFLDNTEGVCIPRMEEPNDESLAGN